MSFTGIPPEAIGFYQELEHNNSKPWWSAHAQIYADAVKAPLQALLAELEGEFGSAVFFRPYRDVRFSADRSPYKTHQGAYVPLASGLGWYLQIGPEGLFVGGGLYQMAPDQVARYRAAVDADSSGQALVEVADGLVAKGFELGGEQLKSRPRGVAADHPRLDLLRHRSLTAGREHGEPPWLSTPEALDHTRSDWRALRPMVVWLDEHVGAAATPRR